jgi:hypothetical protein
METSTGIHALGSAIPNNCDTSQKRAIPGGEFGPNGEWYKGGAFIATKDLPKRMREWIKRTKTDRLVTVELSTRSSRGIQAEGRIGEFPIAPIVINALVYGEINTAHIAYWRNKGESAHADMLVDMVQKYLAGERWLRVVDYPRLAGMDDVLRLILAGHSVPEESFEALAPWVRGRLQEMARYMANKGGKHAAIQDPSLHAQG